MKTRSSGRLPCPFSRASASRRPSARTVAALRSVMPADEILVHVYEPGLKAVRTLARATAEGGMKIDRVTPVPVDPRSKPLAAEAVIVSGMRPDAIT